jgi:hypothetical protein
MHSGRRRPPFLLHRSGMNDRRSRLTGAARKSVSFSLQLKIAPSRFTSIQRRIDVATVRGLTAEVEDTACYEGGVADDLRLTEWAGGGGDVEARRTPTRNRLVPDAGGFWTRQPSGLNTSAEHQES